MIHFPRLRTARLDVQLRELTAREAIALAAIPPEQHEVSTGAVLRLIVERAAGPHADPARWTVQERAMVVAQYLSATSAEGGNFAVGEGAFLDYLDADRDGAPDSAEAGEACGDTWTVRQLIGAEAECLEPLCHDRFDWLCGDMAARLRAAGDPGDAAAPDAVADPAAYSTWLAERMKGVGDMAESDLADLAAAYRRGLAALHHLFHVEPADDGFVLLPNRATTTEAEGDTLPPARFPGACLVSDLARRLCPGPR